MADIKKVIEGFEHCIPDPKKPLKERLEENECRHETCPYGPYGNHGEEGMGCFWDLMSDALELLKEQEQIITSLKADLQETLKVVSEQSNVIRCKDCNKRGTSECYVENASGELAFPWIPPDDWFCADGEPT